MIKANDGEATYSDRNQKIKELAIQMMKEFPDYKKSLFKHHPSKVTLFGKKIGRAQLEAEQEKGRRLYEERLSQKQMHARGGLN